MATRCLAMQSAGRAVPPAFTSTSDFSISDNDGGDLLTTTGPTKTEKRVEEIVNQFNNYDKKNIQIYISCIEFSIRCLYNKNGIIISRHNYF